MAGRAHGQVRQPELAGGVLTTPAIKGSDRRAGAFTLVEALVALAVIAVLLGITVPALRSARRAAGGSECRARLAGIGRMYELSVSEHAGRWPTLDYPTRPNGSPDVLRTAPWGDAYWFVLSVNEMTFWGFPLRDYATERGALDRARAIEALSCPVVHGRWLDAPDDNRAGDLSASDPMSAPQASYFHSFALFTAPSGWAESSSPPEINAIHAPVMASDIAHPSHKASLVEKASHHSAHEERIDAAPGSRELFNILAADGHVERRWGLDARRPAGFTAFYTGMEIPPQRPDAHAMSGIPYVSTAGGAMGRDW